MAKGNVSGAAVQFKVHLKPTDVGARVIERMGRPHLDKSAELRRLIELGFAAEQAGFILDGTELRNGGRVWLADPVSAGHSILQNIHPHPTQSQAASSNESSESSSNPYDAAHGTAATLPPSGDLSVDVGDGGMRANLRRLSNI